MAPDRGGPGSGVIPCTLAVCVASAAVAGVPCEVVGPCERGRSCACAEPRPVSPLVHLPVCFPANIPAEEIKSLIEGFDLLPPSLLLERGAQRFFNAGTVWQGDGGQGSTGDAIATHLTYSFPDDGVTWGTSGFGTGPNALNFEITSNFGSGNLDAGRELIRQGIATWRKYSALTYDEVADNNSSMDTSVARIASRGDVRIGGLNYGGVSFLAYNMFPTSGGDMTFNNFYFIATNFLDPTDSFRYLRNVAAHEHGHGIGSIHSVPCGSEKLMEPFITTAFDLAQLDDVRGAMRSYGDRLAGNHSPGSAHDFGSMTSPAPRSVILPWLSTNGASGAGGTDEDWFRFTLDSTQTLTIGVTPEGRTMTIGQQTSSCAGSLFNSVTDEAGDLELELRDAAGVGVIATSSSTGPGGSESIAMSLAPGEYTIRVRDIGPNPADNQTVQVYHLDVDVNGALAPPWVVAGLNKRIEANIDCWFMGNHSTEPTEPGATIDPVNGYDWDLDGDSVFETIASAFATQQYVSNGVYPVTLRATDSFGTAGFDTILVVVHSGVTSLDAASPTSGAQGAIVPIVLTGTNLKNVVASSEFAVSGSGVAISGTPVADALGTQVSGLSLEIDPGAALGARDISVSNTDGSATGVGVFAVVEAIAGCPGDADGNSVVDVNDIAFVIFRLGDAGGPADVDGSGIVDVNDIAFVIFRLGACP